MREVHCNLQIFNVNEVYVKLKVTMKFYFKNIFSPFVAQYLSFLV